MNVIINSEMKKVNSTFLYWPWHSARLPSMEFLRINYLKLLGGKVGGGVGEKVGGGRSGRKEM